MIGKKRTCKAIAPLKPQTAQKRCRQLMGTRMQVPVLQRILVACCVGSSAISRQWDWRDRRLSCPVERLDCSLEGTRASTRAYTKSFLFQKGKDPVATA